MVGDVSKSDLWVEIITTVTGRPVRVLPNSGKAAYGAAVLAAYGVGMIDRQQIVDTLKRRGVDIEFVLFPDEGHGWRKEANRVTSTMEMTRFFREHLLGAR